MENQSGQGNDEEEKERRTRWLDLLGFTNAYYAFSHACLWCGSLNI